MIKRTWYRQTLSRIFSFALFIGALCAILPLFLVFGLVIKEGFSGLNLAFFTELPKPVGETGGGLLNGIAGSLFLIAMSGVIGITWGIGAAVGLSEYSPPRALDRLIRISVDLLASTPSIIFGLFVYVVMVLPMKRFSALSGGIALSFVVLPIVARTAEDFLKRVPGSIREAGLALGVPKSTVILKIVLPTARNGILTGIILALSRAVGETAPLLFTAFGNQFWSLSPDQPIAAMPIQIFNYAISPFDEWHKLAWTGALVLVSGVLVTSLFSRWLTAEKR